MIPEYKTILYATDLTPNSAQAFRHAASLALRYDGRVHILHVLPDIETAVVNVVATAIGEDRLADLELEHQGEAKAEIRQRLERFAREELPPGTPHECVSKIEVVHGEPAERIIEVADRIAADLIVMGSHGRGRLHHALLGSVAHAVLTKSLRPVFISRLTEGPATER